jgi:hypothetical protein
MVWVCIHIPIQGEGDQTPYINLYYVWDGGGMQFEKFYSLTILLV